MEPLSRPFRKLSNINSFSGKHAYDGVVSGRRPNHDGTPAVTVEDYGEIFSSGQADSSIPVLDLATLEQSSGGLDSEIWSTKPDYGMIFGGFRDQHIAISYDELVARDNARAYAPSSASQSSQDLGDLSNQPLDALKQFNMAYNKISQRSRDGLDGTTHVTELHAVPGFTCFMNESASQPKKETKNHKSFVTNNIHPSVNSNKWDFPEKQTSQSTVDSRSRHQDESLSGERTFKTFEADLKLHPSKVSSPPAASQPNKETESQKSYVTNNIHISVNSNKGDFHEPQTSESAVESSNRDQDESFSGERIFKTFEVDLKPLPSKVSSSPLASQPHKETDGQISSSSSPAVSQPNREIKSQKSSSASPAVSQPNKETKSQRSSSPAASQPNKETESQKTSSTPAVSQPNKETKSQKSSSVAASQPNKETESQNSYIANSIHSSVNSSKGDFDEKQTSQSAVESGSRYGQDESISDDRIFKTFEADLKPHPSKVLSPPAASQPNKETKNQKSVVTNNIHPSVNSSKGDIHEKETSQDAVETRGRYQDEYLSNDRIFNTFEVDLKPHPSKVSSPPAASQPNKETENQKSSITSNIHLPVNSSKGDFHEKTSQSTVDSKSRHQDESLSGDIIFKTSEVDLKPHPSKVSSPPAASQSNKETENQKSYITNNIHPSVNSSNGDFHEKQTLQSAVESRSTYDQDESISDDSNFKKFQADLRSHLPKVSSSPAVPATNFDNHKDYQKRSAAAYGESPPCFDEELDVNSAAAVSAAALRKAIEKAQESIRIAKESMGRKKGFSSKSFKDNLKVKAKVANVKADEEYKEKDYKMKQKDHKHESTVVFSDFMDGEKRFGAKKVINELHGKIPELDNNSKILIRSSVELRESKILCSSKRVVGKKESESIENNTCESPQKDIEKPNVFLDTESNNLTVHQKVEDEKEIPVKSDETGYEKKFSEELFGLFETNKQENVEQEHDKKVGSAASQVEDEREVKEEEKEKLYDVLEVGMVKHAETFDCSTETNDLSQKEDYEIKEKENDKVPETYEKSSIEFDDVEESKSVIGASQIANDPEEACKDDQNDNNAESSQEVDDVSRSSSSGHEFQVEDTEAIEKERIENISSIETEDNKDECDAKSDDLANCGLADIEANDASQKEYYEIKEEENHKAEETWQNLDKNQVSEIYENPSSGYNDAEESGSVIGSSQIIVDTEEACKVDKNDNKAESSQEIDDVSSSSRSGHDFQVEDMEALEKEMIENISSDETEDNDDKCDAKSDDLANCGLADVDSESSSDTVLGMEIEVKEHKEKEESVEKEDNNLQQSHEETPEIRTKMETGTQQEPEDASRESEPSKMERDRIKLAVDRAIREARERAFAEVRQRVIAETQEKVTKASSDKTKLIAERAAVERATAGARQRALEKAISQKQMSEPKLQVNINHTNAESALRSKAKLEKDYRIMERAAKALAEKEKRDLLALKEQAERNRLAENLDADIKRWSSGKEGNLRALLSTLQYILGADSGWQPVSLTEIITTSSVKKAYRKATLCVHPDKLQQRGASIQQKYICEKVFDLLKAAWNRFNSEER